MADDRPFRYLRDEPLAALLDAARHSASVNPAGSDAHTTAKSMEQKVLAERTHRDGGARGAYDEWARTWLVPGRELSEFEIYHLIRREPRVLAAMEAQREFYASPAGHRALLAEITGSLGELDRSTGERYQAHVENVFTAREQARREITASGGRADR